jgi:hypothetical protein
MGRRVKIPDAILAEIIIAVTLVGFEAVNRNRGNTDPIFDPLFTPNMIDKIDTARFTPEFLKKGLGLRTEGKHRNLTIEISGIIIDGIQIQSKIDDKGGVLDAFDNRVVLLFDQDKGIVLAGQFLAYGHFAVYQAGRESLTGHGKNDYSQPEYYH